MLPTITIHAVRELIPNESDTGLNDPSKVSLSAIDLSCVLKIKETMHNFFKGMTDVSRIENYFSFAGKKMRKYETIVCKRIRLQKTIAELQRHFQEGSKNVFLTVILAKRYKQVNHLQNQLQCMHKILKMYPEDQELKHHIGKLFIYSDVVQRAKEKLEQLDQRQSPIYLYIVRHIISEAADQKPLDQYHIRPSYTSNQRDFVEIMKHLNTLKKSQAEKEYNEVLGLKLTDPEIYQSFGEFLSSRGENDLAKMCYMQGISQNQDDVELHLRLAELSSKMKNIQMQISCYECAVKIDPNRIALYEKLGNLHQIKKEFQKALGIYEAGLKIDSQNTKLLEKVGIAAFELHKFDYVIRNFKKYSKMAVLTVENSYKFIVSLLCSGLYRDAIDSLSVFATSKPKQMEYFIGLRFFLFQRKKQLNCYLFSEIAQLFQDSTSTSNSPHLYLFNQALLFNVPCYQGLSDRYLADCISNKTSQEAKQVTKELLILCKQYTQSYEQFKDIVEELIKIEIFLGNSIDLLMKLKEVRNLLVYLKIKQFKEVQNIDSQVELFEELAKINTDDELFEEMEVSFAYLSKQREPLKERVQMNNKMTSSIMLCIDMNASSSSFHSNMLQNSPMSEKQIENKQSLEITKRQKMKENVNYSIAKKRSSKSYLFTVKASKATLALDKLVGTSMKSFLSNYFKNHVYFIRYLSYRRKSFKYIAWHDIDENDVKKDKNTYVSFKFKVEKGLSDFVSRSRNANKTEPEYASMIRQGGRREVLSFIYCLANGIMELQSHGIFHADLHFRNVIKVANEQKENLPFLSHLYKIIDFNYAFKISRPSTELYTILLNHTRNIIKYWLSQDKQVHKRFIRYLFAEPNANLECRLKNKLNGIRETIRTNPIQLQESVTSITEELQTYSLAFHKRKMKDMINLLCKRDTLIIAAADMIDVREKGKNMEGYQTLIKILKDELQRDCQRQ